MKKNLIFILLLFLFNCSAEKQQITPEKCPRVLFSKEHKTYITSSEKPLTINNLSYKAELNNYSFNKECFVSNNVLTSNISLLFVIKPNKIDSKEILLPFYVTTLSLENEVLDMQYYSAKGIMKKDPATFDFVETELVYTFNYKIQNYNFNKNFINAVVVGFMLDQEKVKLLN